MSRRKVAREVGEFGLSFLDVISCGFGAVILLLIITKTVEPIVLEQTTLELEAKLERLQEELFDIRGETRVVQRELSERQAQLDRILERLAQLQREQRRVRGQYATARGEQNELDAETERLAAARQSLSEEMRRLLGQQADERSQTVGGVPVDSEYIIFVIDTSGSMRTYAWDLMIQKMEETLRIYPQVKGIQVMSDMGNYMFGQIAGPGRWLADSPETRQRIRAQLRSWSALSNSSPVEGINEAIGSFYQPGRKISVYVLGDEFSGQQRITQVVETIDAMNRASDDGRRLVRIHAIGFPVFIGGRIADQTTGVRFAALMREVTARNGGTFVGLNTIEVER